MRPIRTLSLVAALALLPLSQAVAKPTEAAARLDTAAEAFEARMEAFGQRAEAIGEDQSLSEEERGRRIAAVWAEYAPDVAAFTAMATSQASAIAADALSEIDVEALVAEALAGAEVERALAAAQGLSRNWAQNPEMLETLVEAALVQAEIAVEDMEAAVEAAQQAREE